MKGLAFVDSALSPLGIVIDELAIADPEKDTSTETPTANANAVRFPADPANSHIDRKILQPVGRSHLKRAIESPA